MPNKRIKNEQGILIRDLYKAGLSGSEISSRLNLSLRQIYKSLHRQNVPCRNTKEQNRISFEKKVLSFNFREHLSSKERELMIAAVMLYYGEGAKTGTTVDLANSDERVAKLFVKFLRKICRIDENKLRLYLYCFSNQNSSSLINYWSSQLRVEKRQFTRPYVRSAVNRGKRSMPHGVIHVRYSDKKLLQRILSLCYSMISSL